MDMYDYQTQAVSFATGGGATLDYAVLGLAEEAGEVAGKVAKFIRRTGLPSANIMMDPDARNSLILELGDCLWMIANAAERLGVSLDRIAEMNLAKLDGRKARGTIVGDGDYR